MRRLQQALYQPRYRYKEARPNEIGMCTHIPIPYASLVTRVYLNHDIDARFWRNATESEHRVTLFHPLSTAFTWQGPGLSSVRSSTPELLVPISAFAYAAFDSARTARAAGPAANKQLQHHV